MKPNEAPFSTISFSDLKFHQLTLEEAVHWIEHCIQKDRLPRFLCTLNATLIVWAQKDPFLKETYLNADLATVDSNVVRYALKLLGFPVPEAVEACQIMFEFIKRNYHKGYRFYFLGSKPEIVKKATERLQKTYPGIQIVGYHDGYFSAEEAPQIAKAIQATKPDCLFVGMSSPLKERFLREYIPMMDVPISLGVGGGIDILAGEYRWAPAWVRNIGFAWFYRFLCEPRRMWKRYLTTNTIFLWLFFKTLIRKAFR